MAFTYPNIGQDTPIDSVDSVYSIALKYAREIIKNSGVTSKYADFDKTEIDYGAIIENLRIKLTASTTPDSNAAHLLAPNYLDVIAHYMADYEEKQFNTVIRENNAKSVVTGAAKMEELVAKMIETLDQSEISEANKQYKQLFGTCGAVANKATLYKSLISFGLPVNSEFDSIFFGGYLGTNDVTDNPNGLGQFTNLGINPTHEKVFTTVRDIVKDMQYENDTYSNGYSHESMSDDIRIIVPFKYLNKTSVDFLSKLFNLEKADLLARIVETDGNYFTGQTLTDDSGDVVDTLGAIIVCTVDAIGRVVKGRSTHAAWDRERRGMGYTNYLDEAMFFLPFEKAYAIVWGEKKKSDDLIPCTPTIITVEASPSVFTSDVTITKTGGGTIQNDFAEIASTPYYTIYQLIGVEPGEYTFDSDGPPFSIFINGNVEDSPITINEGDSVFAYLR